MRLALASVVVIACSSPAAGPAQPAPPRATIDPLTVEFLLASAAADFRGHQPPTGFRGVRAGYVTGRDGRKQYLLCGHFLPAQGDWSPFVTVKTSDYEQYLGPQAAGWCQASSFTRSDDDLSASLQSRFDSLR